MVTEDRASVKDQDATVTEDKASVTDKAVAVTEEVLPRLRESVALFSQRGMAGWVRHQRVGV